MTYQTLAQQLKIISDVNRLEIINMLSCGELCACDLLEHFQISQPTLSHHMKILVEGNMVNMRKEGNKRMYQLNHHFFNELKETLEHLSTSTSACACHSLKMGDCEG
ncbi:ArsR/SmtB family transcription factor [Staphylococcus chromogenes]|uniref:ArsR/SmtB family transcription factor n=1 Tax=Staphylococcus chromogenes TaxID=46126 RepID=UPI0028FF3180|nr:metalloregulator ArsR/SmtB family transcription factor [Staphylococcus chromogenes]MDU0451389.1 metalloregulator ArsR/SmtB family transcription factor [Staphylococcus chromogenes]